MFPLYFCLLLTFKEGGRKSQRQPNKLERDGVVNLDDANFEEAMRIETDSDASQENSIAARSKRLTERQLKLKKRQGKAKIKDTTQIKKNKAEKREKEKKSKRGPKKGE